MTEPPLVEGTTRRGRYREAEAVRKRLDPAERRAFLRAYVEQERAILRDRPIPGWLARRSSRRALALAGVLPLACLSAAGSIERTSAGRFGFSPLLGLVGLVVFVVCWVLLRRATALLADAPDGALDEREREERGRVYLHSYQALGALVTLVTIIGILNEGDRLFTDIGLSYILIGLMLTASLLPSAVSAWRWRDLPD